MQPIAEWAARNGVTLRYQTSYGKDMEVAQTALYPDIPETESLYGNDHMDFYRLQAGAVHAMGRAIYSMETAAECTETWNPKGDDGNYGTRGNGERQPNWMFAKTYLDFVARNQYVLRQGQPKVDVA